MRTIELAFYIACGIPGAIFAVIVLGRLLLHNPSDGKRNPPKPGRHGMEDPATPNPYAPEYAEPYVPVMGEEVYTHPVQIGKALGASNQKPNTIPAPFVAGDRPLPVVEDAPIAVPNWPVRVKR